MKKYIMSGLLAAIAFIGCSKSEPAVGNTSEIRITATGFSNTSVTIASGTSVTWVNDDTQVHTVTTDDGRIDSGDITAGQRFTYTFIQPGTYSYACKYHPLIKGVVIVTGIR